MLLVVDVGNTQTHFGAFRGEEVVEHWRFATVRQSTADQLGAALRNLMELRGYGFGDLEASIVSSTVPQLEPEWTAMASRYLRHEMLVVGPGTFELALPAFDEVVSATTFTTGQTYAEWREGDKVAKYGLTALVAGGAGAAAMKLGLFGKLWKVIAGIFAAAGKAIIAAVAGLAAWLRSMFRKKEKPDSLPAAP